MKIYRANGERSPFLRMAPWLLPEADRKAYRDGRRDGIKLGAFAILVAQFVFLLVAAHVYLKVVGA